MSSAYKMFVLNRVSFGDFDIAQYTAVAVSSDKGHLRTYKAELQAELSKEEIDQEVHFEIQPELVVVV